MIVKPFEIDKTKIKRFFAFGCSFTNNFWPTWATVLSKELDHAEFYNFGKSGLGNLGISVKLAEAHTKFNFSETDLVFAMSTTFLREDHWVKGGWINGGCVYSSGSYDRKYIENYTDVTGFIIRDFGLLTLCKNFLDTLPCQAMLFPSVPLNFIDTALCEVDESLHNRVIDTYKNLYDNMPISLYESIKVNHNWPIGHSYYWEGQLHHDPHPSPIAAYNYIHNNIMTLSKSTEKYALDATEKLLSFKHKKEIIEYFEHDTKEYLLF